MSIEQWPELIERAIARSSGSLAGVTVLRETNSTQDAARRQGARPGDVVVAWRQTAGHGRLGRSWIDTGKEGVAATFVIPRGQPERLAIATAIGAAAAIEGFLTRACQIKWPNDLIVDGGKIGGILIEQSSDAAYVGVGINVSQRAWPEELATRAISLAQAGVVIDRIEVIAALIEHLPRAWLMTEDALAAEFARRDVVCGAEAAFRCGNRIVTGRVVSVDPLHGLVVRTVAGEVQLPAATTSFIQELELPVHPGQEQPRRAPKK